VKVDDRRLARIIQRTRDLPGQDLFQYLDDDGEPHTVGSGDVNDYLREITGEDYTAKDFRTWSGTVLAALALQEFEKFDSEAQAKKNIVRAIEHGGRAARQYAVGVPQVLCASGRARLVCARWSG
jgi:DNA topoisomerase-1